jgi:hypothetical protein
MNWHRREGQISNNQLNSHKYSDLPFEVVIKCYKTKFKSYEKNMYEILLFMLICYICTVFKYYIHKQCKECNELINKKNKKLINLCT